MHGTNVTLDFLLKEDAAVKLPVIATLPSSVHEALILDAEKNSELQDVAPKSNPGHAAKDGTTSVKTRSQRKIDIDDEFMVDVVILYLSRLLLKRFLRKMITFCRTFSTFSA